MPAVELRVPLGLRSVTTAEILAFHAEHPCLEGRRWSAKLVPVACRRYRADCPTVVFLFDKVGNRLKSPVNPIWVVCSESHYSVLFCPDRSTVPSSPIATMVATTAAVEGAGEQAAACKAGGRNPSRTAAHDPANATHFGGADRKHDTYGGGGTGNDTLRLASRGGTGEYEEGVDGTPPWEEKDDKEEFHLEYYDGLGRQDEVR